MKYLLKRCGHQELGSMDSSMRPQRGQYLLMAMRKEVLSFFPPLSTTQQNDYRIVPFVPLYTHSKVYCRFVYHNDKFHGSVAAHPRNEYRLYLNKELQGGKLKYYEGGIVVFRMVDETDFEKGMFLDYASPQDGTLYKTYNGVLASCKLDSSGNYGVYSGVINDFESRVTNVSSETTDVQVSNEDINFISNNQNEEASLFNEVSFRDFVMVGYQRKCAVTRTAIEYGDLYNLETAHIHPKAHGGSFLPNNGMMLCRDFHWAFDHGFFTLSDDLKVIVSKKMSCPMLAPYDGKQIFIPSNPFFRPDISNVKWHREHVFEHFGQIKAMKV